jgi:hypothetical protein
MSSIGQHGEETYKMTFSPPRSVISGITQANPCVVTTASDHDLSTGQVVRLHVPQNFGMVNLNNNTYSVTVLSTTTFSIQYTQVPISQNVNSIFYPAFTTPSNPRFTAEVISVGSGPTPLSSLPWQVLNNVCDNLLGDATHNVATTNQPY